MQVPGYKDGKDCKSRILGIEGELRALYDLKVNVRGRFYDEKECKCWYFVIRQETTMNIVNKNIYSKIKPKINVLLEKK